MSVGSLRARPPAWDILERAINDKRTIRVSYHDHERLLCPHLLGWRNGRAKVLSYQSAGTTSQGVIAGNPRQRWRSMFVDEIEGAVLTNDIWQTGPNYTADCNSVDVVEVAVEVYQGTNSHTPNTH